MISWLAKDPAQFPESVPEREAFFLDCVRAGDYEVEWLPISVSDGFHSARFWCSADALKIGGVRINVSATLQQQLADVLEASLLTPKLADLLFLEADISLPPMPMPITSSTKAMIEQSAKIDAALAKLSVEPKGKIVQTVGKHWVIANGLMTHQGRAENYGWHFRGNSFGGRPWEQAASGIVDVSTSASLRLIQGQGWAHNAHHVDYSQIACFVLQKCELDGAVVALETILTDPLLAPLASHEGVLQTLRQPGVEKVA